MEKKTCRVCHQLVEDEKVAAFVYRVTAAGEEAGLGKKGTIIDTPEISAVERGFVEKADLGYLCDECFLCGKLQEFLKGVERAAK